MTIRPLRPPDAAEWLRMRVALLPGDDHAREIAEYFAAPESFAVFVFERSERALGGFIEVGLRSYAEGCESSPVPYIEAWYVDPDLRRGGVGRALIREAEEWARGKGFVEIGSDALLENETSHAAHKAVGYEEVERIVIFRRSLG